MSLTLEPHTTSTAPATRRDGGKHHPEATTEHTMRTRHDTTTALDGSRLPVRAKLDAQRRSAADVADLRVRTASVEQILRTVT